MQSSGDDPIVSRILRDPSSGNKVELVLYRPQKEEGGNGDWCCKLEIRGVEPPLRDTCWGVDSLQALVTGMTALRYWIKKQRLTELVWLGQPGDLGLPLVVQETEEFLAVIEGLVTVEHSRLVLHKSRLAKPRNSKK